MKSNSKGLAALTAALVGAVVAYLMRPVKRPDASGRWEPIDRHPADR